MNHAEYAISLGGSIIMPGCEVDTKYLKKFSDFLFNQVERAAIVTGGGPLARMYQNSLRAMGVTDKQTLDRAGIPLTHQNAKHLADILNARGVSAAYVPSLKAKRPDVSIWVTGGTKPNQSTDAVAVEWARILGYRQVINITNTPFVYELGPDGKPDTMKPIYEMTDDEYLTLVGPEHEPGENVPAGRSGIKIAKKYGIVFHVIGSDLKNLESCLEGKSSVKKTTIHP
jgi:predicted uridylate kinase